MDWVQKTSICRDSVALWGPINLLLTLGPVRRLAQGSDSWEQGSWFSPTGVCDHSGALSTLGDSPEPLPSSVCPSRLLLVGTLEA